MKNLDDCTHAYAGYCPTCKAMVACSVDTGDPHVRKFVADIMRDGLTVGRVTVEEARAQLKLCDCNRGKSRRAAKQKSAEPLSLPLEGAA